MSWNFLCKCILYLYQINIFLTTFTNNRIPDLWTFRSWSIFSFNRQDFLVKFYTLFCYSKIFIKQYIFWINIHILKTNLSRTKFSKESVLGKILLNRLFWSRDCFYWTECFFFWLTDINHGSLIQTYCHTYWGGGHTIVNFKTIDSTPLKQDTFFTFSNDIIINIY